jgi:hypothetical protein
MFLRPAGDGTVKSDPHQMSEGIEIALRPCTREGIEIASRPWAQKVVRTDRPVTAHQIVDILAKR